MRSLMSAVQVKYIQYSQYLRNMGEIIHTKITLGDLPPPPPHTRLFLQFNKRYMTRRVFAEAVFR